MTTVQKGQKVSFLCSSYLSNGDCLDSGDEEPICMVAGLTGKGNEFSKAVSKSLVGMSIREIKHLKVPPKFVFGEKDVGKIYKIPINETSSHRVGDEIKIKVTDADEAQVLEGTVAKIEGEYAHVDTNHPLAGETIIVKIQVISFD